MRDFERRVMVGVGIDGPAAWWMDEYHPTPRLRQVASLVRRMTLALHHNGPTSESWVQCARAATPTAPPCRFALRYDGKRESEEDARMPTVREAFNSPFWPFALASTSVG